MDEAWYQRIRFERRGRVLTVALNRPEAENATDARMHAELGQVFYDVAADPASDVIVFTGSGTAFSARGDPMWFRELVDSKESWERTRLDAKRIVFGVLDCEKPIIARVNGAAIGFGATLALLCDVVIAAESASFGDPHVKGGLNAGDGGAIIWPQLIGFARAKEYLMTGEVLTAREAERIGLINRAVPDETLDDAVYGLADRLAGGPTRAIQWSKTAANIALKQVAHAIMDASMAYESLTNASADRLEAMRAAGEGRPPRFANAR